jgi:hypothetical protein
MTRHAVHVVKLVTGLDQITIVGIRGGHAGSGNDGNDELTQPGHGRSPHLRDGGHSRAAVSESSDSDGIRTGAPIFVDVTCFFASSLPTSPQTL